MRKYLITIVVILAIPAAVSAFSFSNVINFGRKLFKVDQAPAAAAPAATSTRPFFPELADKKAENWAAAYKQKDIDKVFRDSYNLVFFEGEANYLLNKELAAAPNPPARDIDVKLEKDLVKISGQSLLKNLSGKFYLEGRIETDGQRLKAKVSKARFRGFYFPSFLAERIINNNVKDQLDFLYSSTNYRRLEIEIGGGYFKLNYFE